MHIKRLICLTGSYQKVHKGSRYLQIHTDTYCGLQAANCHTNICTDFKKLGRCVLVYFYLCPNYRLHLMNSLIETHLYSWSTFETPRLITSGSLISYLFSSLLPDITQPTRSFLYVKKTNYWQAVCFHA